MQKVGVWLSAVAAVIVYGAEYQVEEVWCREGESQLLSAHLRRPAGFRGQPAFADNRRIVASTDERCQIRPSSNVSSPASSALGDAFRLRISDFQLCPVGRQDGFLRVRVWFPQLDGVLLAEDQEVVILCRPPDAVVTEKRATGFMGTLGPAGRVSGVVEQGPGQLEYALALFRESTPRSGQFDVPVEGPVSLGTGLQLRAAINTRSSAWKYVKLVDVTASPDPRDADVPGSVTLVRDGCRLPALQSIVPQQPRRADDTPGEVSLDLEAFLLDGPGSQLWVHAQIRACVDAVDCLADFCSDLYQTSGHGRRRRRDDTKGPSAQVGDNVALTVLTPQAAAASAFQRDEPALMCAAWEALAGVLGCLVLFAAGVTLIMARRLTRALRPPEAKIRPP